MSLSFTFCTFGCVESTMNGDDKGGRRTARRQVSKVHVAKPTGSGKKVLTIGGGLDLDNIVSTGRRGNARNARGKIASASSTGKRRTVLEAASAAAGSFGDTCQMRSLLLRFRSLWVVFWLRLLANEFRFNLGRASTFPRTHGVVRVVLVAWHRYSGHSN